MYVLLVNQTEAGLAVVVASRSAGRFTGNIDSKTGLCPIRVLKQPLNRRGRFARLPDTRFGQLANRSEQIHNHKYDRPRGSGKVMWGLGLASEIFHDFSLTSMVGKDAHPAARHSKKECGCDWKRVFFFFLFFLHILCLYIPYRTICNPLGYDRRALWPKCTYIISPTGKEIWNCGKIPKKTF